MDRLERHSEPAQVDRYERLARKALSGYGLADVRLTYLGTSSHTTFEVTTGDPTRHYALRVCGPDGESDALEREILWLTALCRDTDLTVPEPILSMDGQLARKVAIAGVHGVRPCILFRWVEGASLDEDLAPEHLRSVGRLLAALHVHAETFRWPEELTPARRNATLMSDVLDQQLLRTCYEENDLDLFGRAVDRITETMARLRDGPNVAGVIHGDLRWPNVRFFGTDARVFGFERCRWGYYAYDLAVVEGWIERRDAAREMLAALLAGYRSVRELPDEVERSVPVFAALRSIDRIQSMLRRPDRSSTVDQLLNSEVEALRSALAEAE